MSSNTKCHWPLWYCLLSEPQCSHLCNLHIARTIWDMCAKFAHHRAPKPILLHHWLAVLPVCNNKNYWEAGMGQEKLPTAATCFNTLNLPLYENEALMTRKLCMAMANCEGYGLVWYVVMATRRQDGGLRHSGVWGTPVWYTNKSSEESGLGIRFNW